MQEITHRTTSMAGAIVMLEGHVMPCQPAEGYHMRGEDIFPLTHSIDALPQTMTLHIQIVPALEYTP